MSSTPRWSRGPLSLRTTMAEMAPNRPNDDASVEGAPNGASQLEELRNLILGPEQEALERLHQRISNPESRTKDVSGVVAEAIQMRREEGGDQALSEALTPTIETALRESVRKEPGALANALFPIMGPAIRRSILEALRSFLESFNEVLDKSFSWQGMKWRVEALRTGRSFTEVALLHSLVFRVEQVHFIHKNTGLSLGHVVAPAVAMQDPSLVSGMLSAIQDFVRDSFSSEQGQAINRMEVGELEVWVEEGPYAILAAVIRGIAPRALRNSMAEVLENLHSEYSVQLAHFNGDTAPFAEATQQLSHCLASKFKEEPRAANYKFVWVAVGILFCFLSALIGWRWWQYHRWNNLVQSIREQPGLVITSFGREHGHYVVRGLRDPLAVNPYEFVQAAHLNPADAEFHWGAYYALDDSIIQRRATMSLGPPTGVVLTVQDGVLGVTGLPSAQWLKNLRSRALLVPGIHELRLPPELNPDRLAFAETKAEIESVVFKFPVASATLSTSELTVLRGLVPKLQSLTSLADALHSKATIMVVGHSDASGAESMNEDLSQRRADHISAELIRLGIPQADLRARGVASSQPLRPEDSEANREFNRSVTFEITSMNLR